MDFQKILEQTELGRKAIEEMKNQTRNFDRIMDETVKNVPAEHKKEVDEIRMLAKRSIELAKQGKGDEAQQLIKDFRNGRTH